MSSSIVGVMFLLGVLVSLFGCILHSVFERVSFHDGILGALTTALLISVIMGRSFFNSNRITAPLGLLRVLFLLLLVMCSLELYQRPIVEFSLNMTKTSIETSESVKKLEKSGDWFDNMKRDLKESAEKFKLAVKP